MFDLLIIKFKCEVGGKTDVEKEELDTKNGITLEAMNDFPPPRDIVTVGWRQNDGTHVRANGPFR